MLIERQGYLRTFTLDVPPLRTKRAGVAATAGKSESTSADE